MRMKVILRLVSGIAAFGIAAIIFVYLSLGGSREVFSEDVSGRNRVQFSVSVARTLGNPVKHLLIDGMEDTGIPYSIAITNRSDHDQKVICKKHVDGSNAAKMISLVPGETQQVFDGVGRGAGIVLGGLSRNSREFVIEIDFDNPLPTGTRLNARMVWADGP